MNRKASLAIIFATVFIDLLGFGILIPLLPNFAKEVLSISEFQIGIIIASYSFIQFVFNPIMGQISDRFGRRPVILVTLLVTASSYILFSFATSFVILLFSRILAGLGGSNIGAAQAYIADITSKEERAKGMGMIGAAFGLGFTFGPAIGGVISHSYGYASAGYLSAGLSITAFLFGLFMLKESHKSENRSLNLKIKVLDLKAAYQVLRSPKLGLPVFLFFIIVFSMANIYGTFALLGSQEYNFTDREIGYLFGIVGICSAAIQGGLIRYIGKYFKERTIVLSGLILMFLGLLFIPYGFNFTGVAIVSIVLGIGTSLLQPTVQSIISKRTSQKSQGSILGISQAFSAGARVLGPLWGGFAFEYISYAFPFLTGAFFTLITIFVVQFYFKFDEE